MSVVTALKKVISHPLLVTLLRIALGLVFIIASLDKIESPDDFAQNIANYRLLPYQMINILAIVLPWLEIIIGFMLVIGVWIKSGTIIINGMLVVFIIAISQALIRNLDISCGCFSTDPAAHKMTRWTLYWDIIWLAWGMIVIAYDDGKYTLPAILLKIKKG